MNSYKQTTKFNKSMQIPEAILQNMELEEENIIYWTIYVDNNILKLSLSINQETEIPNTVYTTKGKYKKNSTINFPTDIIQILKLEGQPIQWQTHKEKHDITIISPYQIKCHKNKLNRIITSKKSKYKEYYNGIIIPEHILNNKKITNTEPTQCYLYKYDNTNVFILNDNPDIIKDSDYTLILIFPIHITNHRGQHHLILSQGLNEYLNLEDGEEISWQTYYHNGEIILGFTKKHSNPNSETSLKLTTENNIYYLQIPQEIQTLLKNKKTLLWKRYKHKQLSKINITPDEPRYYKHRKTGKSIRNTDIKQEKTDIPKDIVEHMKITDNTLVNWKLNTEEKRYKYIELNFT